jgi:SSS family solute:Na+ symporter
MAIAAGVHPTKYGANGAVPALIDAMFPGPVAGFMFAAIAIGALVPASVMSIAAANLFNRNIYREFFRRDISNKEETRVSQIVSLLVKIGALAFILFAPTQYAITFQLAGGVWIIQTLPAVFLALYVRWLNGWAVLAGWIAGIAWGTWMLLSVQFKTSTIAFAIPGIGKETVYIGLLSFLLNLVVAIVLSAILLPLTRRREAAEIRRPALG